MAEQPAAFSTSEAFRFGWEKTKTNLKPLLIIGAIGAFLAVLHQSLVGSGRETGLRMLMGLLVQIVQACVGLAYVRSALRLYDAKSIDLSKPAEVFFEDFFPYLLTSILYSLVVAAGLVLLIVPGVIWGLMFMFATYLVVDKKLDPISAFVESKRLTKGIKGQLLGFALLAIGINLLGALALGVGLLFTIPITVIAGAYVLRRLQERAGARAPESHEPPILTPRPPVEQP
ncbi:MAG: hypothetical protein JST54_09340 [Deltaproteobacteria bacterium]|nr:hypothetical protein [Deltaproteobacteria bacterium]